MSRNLSTLARRLAVLAAAVFVYCMVYPDDLQAALAPVSLLLGLTNSVSPWVYALAAVGLICWTIRRTWGPCSGPDEARP